MDKTTSTWACKWTSKFGTFGPDTIDPTVNATYLYKETGIVIFGYYKKQKESDGKVHPTAEVRGIEGITRPGSHLDLKPE